MCSGVLIGDFLDVLKVEAGFEAVQIGLRRSRQRWQCSRGVNELSSRNRGDYDGSLDMHQVTEWYAIHFGYYFCNILVMIFGELSNNGKKSPKRFEANRTRVYTP